MSAMNFARTCLTCFIAVAMGATAFASEQDTIRERVARGELLPLSTLIADATKRHPGKVLEVELEGTHKRPVYEIEVLRDDGTIVELEYDARNGRLLETEVERRLPIDDDEDDTGAESD